MKCRIVNCPDEAVSRGLCNDHQGHWHPREFKGVERWTKGYLRQDKALENELPSYLQERDDENEY